MPLFLSFSMEIQWQCNLLQEISPKHLSQNLLFLIPHTKSTMEKTLESHVTLFSLHLGQVYAHLPNTLYIICAIPQYLINVFQRAKS